MTNIKLIVSKKTKNDEYYTLYEDIEKEIQYYIDVNPFLFEGKTIYCNCDNPFESNFFKYFVNNFNKYKIKKLITTHYIRKINKENSSQLLKTGQNKLKELIKNTAYKVEINNVSVLENGYICGSDDIIKLLEDKNNSYSILMPDETYEAGDFRSFECIEILKKSDIIITNPPFSLLREFLAKLFEYKKDFIILGNFLLTGYKNNLKLIKEGKLKLGASVRKGKMYFMVDKFEKTTKKSFIIEKDGNVFINISQARWWTNLEHSYKCDFIPLTQKYSEDKYKKFDFCEIINVDKVKDIPMDYDGIMGVPISFINKYNENQFEILGDTHTNGFFVNPGFTVPLNDNYMIDGKQKFTRIFIKKR